MYGQDAVHEVLGGFLARRAAVGEAHLVADHLVAEEGVDLVVGGAGDVGPVERVRILHGVLGVAGEAGLAQAAGQHLLVGGHPLDAGVAHHVDDLLGDRALGRPHPLGRLAEGLAVELHAAVDLLDGVQRIAEAAGQLDVGHSHLGQVGVEEQRQDGMEEGGGGDFDLAGVLQALVQRDHLGHQPGMFGQHSGLVGLGEVAALGHQAGQGLLGQPIGVGPAQVEEHLQVEPVLLGPLGAVGAVVGQRLVAREAGDDLGVDVEEAALHELLVLVGQLSGRYLGVDLVEVLGAAFQVLQLAQQRGRQVEGRGDAGVVLQDRGHVHVVLGRVQPHPGLLVDAGCRVLEVDRLVLVPEDAQVQRFLGRLRRRCRRWLRRRCGCRLRSRRGSGGRRGRSGRRRSRRRLATGRQRQSENQQNNQDARLSCHGSSMSRGIMALHTGSVELVRSEAPPWKGGGAKPAAPTTNRALNQGGRA